LVHTRRLRELLQRFRNEELELAQSLRSLLAEIDFWQRETAIARTIDTRDADRLAAQVTDLQDACDLTADELAHVRLALLGTAEELAAHHAGEQVAEAVA
jgi:hypothetical protein